MKKLSRKKKQSIKKKFQLLLNVFDYYNLFLTLISIYSNIKSVYNIIDTFIIKEKRAYIIYDYIILFIV
jgi:hypothetical protein